MPLGPTDEEKLKTVQSAPFILARQSGVRLKLESTGFGNTKNALCNKSFLVFLTETKILLKLNESLYVTRK